MEGGLVKEAWTKVRAIWVTTGVAGVASVAWGLIEVAETVKGIPELFKPVVDFSTKYGWFLQPICLLALIVALIWRASLTNRVIWELQAEVGALQSAYGHKADALTDDVQALAFVDSFSKYENDIWQAIRAYTASFDELEETAKTPVPPDHETNVVFQQRWKKVTKEVGSSFARVLNEAEERFYFQERMVQPPWSKPEITGSQPLLPTQQLRMQYARLWLDNERHKHFIAQLKKHLEEKKAWSIRRLVSIRTYTHQGYRP
jgi:hypothetical protein